VWVFFLHNNAHSPFTIHHSPFIIHISRFPTLVVNNKMEALFVKKRLCVFLWSEKDGMD